MTELSKLYIQIDLTLENAANVDDVVAHYRDVITNGPSPFNVNRIAVKRVDLGRQNGDLIADAIDYVLDDSIFPGSEKDRKKLNRARKVLRRLQGDQDHHDLQRY